MNGRQESLSGVVLAGGQNRRMGGRLKAMLQLQGQLFIERQLEELGKLCGEILIIANDPAPFEKLLLAHSDKNLRVIPDLMPGKGPLAGMQAAMEAAQGETLWVVACDMPNISEESAKAMLELINDDYDAVVPILDGRTQPLHAIYQVKQCKDILDELLAANQYRVMEFMHKLNYKQVDEQFFVEKGISVEFAVNVNDPEQYEKLQYENK
ncbi:molybdenum cofactor guanylyltransferase [Paenibacillus sp. UNC451MF]|uniref:molybdenum cofactor guanylyltransferase n=1 Tax=Paenibacillus sp. UNC451MF TaxID=1449063 RepID=UPI00068CA21B|nr:molybdenum cofactor guanylyltransferase [Paenibacillus sp. UNC451MF]